MIFRYEGTPRIRGGQLLATSTSARNLKIAVRNNQITLKTIVAGEGARLDSIAGEEYGDARMYWLIAACSGIGWSMQVPPGTILRIPTDLAQVRAIVG
jgi:hypothetical protein